MKRNFLKLSLLILAVVFTFTLNAAAADSYTYSVTVSGGNSGTVSTSGVHVSGSSYHVSSEGNVIRITGLSAGAKVSFGGNIASVAKGGKYYVKGVRQGGRDNNTVDHSAVTVMQDMDFVVAYGIKGNLTEYTVKYEDQNGNELRPSETYFGNVGDKPVVACLYIEGYQPPALNLTQKLQAGKNEFVFKYTPIATGTPAGTDNGTNGGNGTTGGNGTNGGNGQAPVNNQQDQTAQGQNNNGAGGNAPVNNGQGGDAQNGAGDNNPADNNAEGVNGNNNENAEGTDNASGADAEQAQQEPEDIIDLDDVPLDDASENAASDDNALSVPAQTGFSSTLKTILGTLGLAAIVAAIVIVVKRRSK